VIAKRETDEKRDRWKKANQANLVDTKKKAEGNTETDGNTSCRPGKTDRISNTKSDIKSTHQTVATIWFRIVQ